MLRKESSLDVKLCTGIRPVYKFRPIEIVCDSLLCLYVDICSLSNLVQIFTNNAFVAHTVTALSLTILYVYAVHIYK